MMKMNYGAKPSDEAATPVPDDGKETYDTKQQSGPEPEHFGVLKDIRGKLNGVSGAEGAIQAIDDYLGSKGMSYEEGEQKEGEVFQSFGDFLTSKMKEKQTANR